MQRTNKDRPWWLKQDPFGNPWLAYPVAMLLYWLIFGVLWPS